MPKQTRRNRTYATDHVALGTLLRRLRRKRPLSLQALGEKVGCSRQFISDLERGLRSSSDIRTWIRLADALGRDRMEIVRSAWHARGSLSLPEPARTDVSLDVMLEEMVKRTSPRSTKASHVNDGR